MEPHNNNHRHRKHLHHRYQLPPQQNFSGHELSRSVPSRKRSVSNLNNDLEDERTWHSFKRLRLQGSDECQTQSSSTHSGNAVKGSNTFGNFDQGEWNSHGAPPKHIGQSDEHHSQQFHHHQQQFSHHHHPNSYIYPQENQHSGQSTSSLEEFHFHAAASNTQEKGYSKVNHMLGLLHQQRQQRNHSQTSSELESQRDTSQYAMSSNEATNTNNVQCERHKQQRRHAVYLPSDSKLM